MYIRSFLFSALAVSSASLLAAPQLESVSNEVDTEARELRINIQGQGFGSGPEVLFFHDFRGVEDGTLVADTDPQIGEMAPSHNPLVGTHLGNKGFWAANEERGRGTMIRTYLGGQYSDIFIAYSVVVPEGRTSPSQTEEETWGASSWKFSWLLEKDGAHHDRDLFDLVLPQQNGNAGTLHGNASQFREIGRGSAANIARMTEWWEWGSFNHMSGWVRADENDSLRSSGNFSVSNKKFGFQSFSTTSDHELVGPGPSVSQVNFPGWVRNTDEDNFQALYSDIYVAGGPNMLARIELTNSESYESSSYRKVLLPNSWAGEKLETSVGLDVFKYQGPLYIHIFNADGERSESGILACQKCPVMN